MDQALITLIILVIVALLFLTEIIPVAVSALSATVALVFFGILTPQEAFSGFSLLVDNAFIAQNPATGAGEIQASVPPASITSASPR